MFETITSFIPRDPDLPERARILDILGRVLDGTLYDVLPYEFHMERTAAGEYIPLRNRRPSVRYGLSRIVVEDSVSLLFSEGHFPAIDCPEPGIRRVLSSIGKECRLNAVLTEAAIRGSVGSSAILFRVLQNRIFLDVLDSKYLTPVWDPRAPDQLLRVTESYKAGGAELAQLGYAVDDTDSIYWFRREWDTETEAWFLPTKVGAGAAEPLLDSNRTVSHGLGFVPVVWIRNLPGPSATGVRYDGACTFHAAIANQIEIDYQLSQAGRGLKYSSDPTLLIKEPSIGGPEIVKSASNALIVSEKGDAKLLEIGGTAATAVLEYVRVLRELALESIHGNRASADRLTAAQSGRALELMNQGLIWLADNLRISYGEGALLQLARMIVAASAKYPLIVRGKQIPELDRSAPLSLKWPNWIPSTADDRQKDAQTLSALSGAGLISRETAVKALASVYDVEDVSDEIVQIHADKMANCEEPE